MTNWRCAQIASKYGVPFWTALKIARIAKRKGIPRTLGFALVEQESNFRNIFGCDFGRVSGVPYCNQKVTRARYLKLRDWAIRTHQGNGVGLTQITYWTYLKDHPGLWRKSAQLKLGFDIIRGYVRTYGERKGLAVYNGGAGNPQYAYADSVLARKRKWAQRFERG